MSKELIKKIIIAILSALFGYQAGNPDSMARAYFLPEGQGWLPEPELP
jgi:hypothetical protein